MSTVQIGNEFEDKVYHLFSTLLEEGDFFLPFKNSKIFQKKHYYSSKRQDDIIFDIAIESYLPKQEIPSFIVFIECKKYSGKVPISDLEEFQAKVSQIAPNANKAILVTNSSFSEQGINFAKSNHIALVRLFDDDKIDWLVTRESTDAITYKEVAAAKSEVEKAFANDDYRIVNNAFVFFNEEPIYDYFSFIESIYKENYTTHSANDTILEKIYAKKAQVKNVDYLSNENLIQIARNLRKEFNIRYGNNQLNLEIKLITRYLNEAFCFSVNFVDDLYVTKPVHYLAGIDYENKTITILNKILQFENRLRFTLIHELSHLILHKQFLHNLKSNREFVFLNEKIKKRIEIQANKLTSYILLPPNELKFELNAIVARFNLNNARGYYVYLDSQTCNQQLWFKISNYLCDKFGVSQDTLEIRLIEMDFLRIGHKDINTFRNFL